MSFRMKKLNSLRVKGGFRLFSLLFYFLICLPSSFSSVTAQSGYGTGNGFNPDNPDIPGACGLYLDKGIVVLDGLSGGTSDDISDAIYHLWKHYCDEQGYGEYSSERDYDYMLEVFDRIHTVLVCADFSNSYEYGIADDIGMYFRKMTTLDLSRTTGWTCDEGLGDGEYLQNLEVLILPDCVEQMVSMSELHNLTDVYCYAELPPTMLEQYSWYYSDPLFADDAEVKVHVPASSLALYQASDAWGKYSIVDMETMIGKIEVKMPQGVDLQQYRNMWLTLTDETTQTQVRYVVTNRQSYFYAGLNGGEGITYAAALVNRFGTVVCQKTGIKLDRGVTKVQLENPLPVTTIAAKIMSVDNRDLTSSVTLTWYDAQGDRITSSPTLAGVVAGDVVEYDVKLPPTMAAVCAQPGRQRVTVSADASTTIVTLQLQAPKPHSFVGFVRDATTGQPLREINVTAIQTGDDGQTFTHNELSYTDGRFIVSRCYEGRLKISLSSREYLRKDIDFLVTSETPEINQIGDYYLQRIDGKTITLQFKETSVGVGQQGNTTSFIRGFDDLTVNVYNESQDGLRLGNISVQYPQIIVLSGANDGDELRLDFTSASGHFDPFSVPVTIDGNNATATATIVYKGGYESTFRSTLNGSVVGIVYDHEGRYVRDDLYQWAKLSVDGLSEGDYTLVTMAYDPVVSRLSTLQALQEMGLQEERDYLKCDFHVSPGILTVIELDEVPVINIDEMKIVHPSSTFSLSEQQVTLGDYVAVRARVKVKNEIAQNSWQYGDFRLLFDLPPYYKYLKGSLMVDGELQEPQYEEGRLVVHSNSFEEGKIVDVRFCITGKEAGMQTVSALLGYRQYDWQNGDKDYYSPAGAASFEAIPMKYNILPETTGQFVATGNGPNGATISAFEDGTLIGQTTVTGKVWGISAPLPSAYNLSLHNVYLECQTLEGITYSTPVTTIMVNADMNVVNRVTMYYPNGYSQRTEVCTWEFLEPDTRVESYDFYPQSKAFTFLIDFLSNDTTEIGDVTLWVTFENGYTSEYPAVFDEERNCWVTAMEIKASPPVGVAVSYTRKKTDKRVDRQLMNSYWSDMAEHVAQQNQLATIISSATEDNIDQKIREAEAILGAAISSDALSTEEQQWLNWFDTLTPEEADEEAQRLLEEFDAETEDLEALLADLATPIDIKGSYTLDDGTVIRVSDCADYNESTILQQGFQVMTTTDGTSIYYFNDSESHMVMIDFASGYAIDIVCQPAGMPAAARSSLKAMVQKCLDFLKNVVLDQISNACNTAIDKINSATNYLIKKKKYLAEHQKYLEKLLQSDNLPFEKKLLAKAQLLQTKVGMMLNAKQLSHIRFLSGLLGKLMILPNYFMLYQKYSKLAKAYESLDDKIPDPCPKAEGAVQNIRKMIDDGMGSLLGYCLGDLAINLTSDIAAVLGIGFSAETLGASLAVTAGSVLFKTAVQWAVDWALESDHLQRQQMIRWCIMALECDDEKPNQASFGDYTIPPEKPHTPYKKPLHDPSGFVCEAVESNRLEDVTATCFYKKEVEDMYGDKHEEVVVWDAENYGQVNPQLTDKDGMYAWMVPAGQWQVLYEKEGYETQRSAWLPVPPPQLDVNVGLVRRAQPELSGGHAYERAIDVDFSLYMKKNYVTPQTLTFWQDGQQLSGELKATNGETAFGITPQDEDYEAPQCASSFRFVPKKTLAVGSQVTVRVNGIVRSYADVPIGEDQELTLTVGREVTSIGSEGNIIVPYGNTHQVVISAQSAQAAAFRQVTISSLSPDIASLETNRITLDAEGRAYITVIGRLPGTTYLQYSVEGSQVSGMDTVRVVSDLDVVPAPKASIISGTYVSEGTQVTLTANEGCTIWYTLDGSCPCDESKRQRYTSPITISGNTTLRCMAVDQLGRESEVVTYTWFIGTGINTAVMPTAAGGIYDLQGRRRDVPASGINIISGKKVVME